MVTGDALFCREGVCDKVLGGGGDYLGTAEGNQPRSHFDIAALFAESAAFPPQQFRRESEQARHATSEKGHGRRGRRTSAAAPVPRDYLAWPGAHQVFPIHRARGLPGRTGQETVYGITSLVPGEAGPERLLELARGHRGAENRRRGVRDVTPGEDACRVRRGGPGAGGHPHCRGPSPGGGGGAERGGGAAAVRHLPAGGPGLTHQGTRQLNGPALTKGWA